MYSLDWRTVYALMRRLYWCLFPEFHSNHYGDVIMGAIASQITSLAVVYSTVYSDADQRKYQSSASLTFVWGIHRGPVNSPHKWPVTRIMFPFDDVIMKKINTKISHEWARKQFVTTVHKLTGVTDRKRSIQVKIGDILSHVTLKLDGWHWKRIGHIFYAASSFVHHFMAIGSFKLKLQSRNNRTPLLCCFKLYASFQSHLWIQTKVKIRKRSIWVKIGDFLSRVTLKFDGWPWKNNKIPLPCYFQLCASFHSHWWIQNGFTVRKHPIWVKMDDFFSRVTWKYYGWPWKTIGLLS